MRLAQKKAFTIVELLVALVIIALILASVIPYIMANLESSRRIRCAANLGTIYGAMTEYFNQSKLIKTYPRTQFDPNRMNWVGYSGSDDSDPFAPNSTVQPNDVTAALWLLVRTGYVNDTSVFICPSSDRIRDPLTDAFGKSVKPSQRGNFRSRRNLAYSILSPYNPSPQFIWDDTLPGDCRILADINPGISGKLDNVTQPFAGDEPKIQRLANSNNHGKAGQNVLYSGGSVQFEQSAFCGYGYKPPNEANNEKLTTGDNIFTALRPTAAGESKIDGPGDYGRNFAPTWNYDSYLVPSDDE